MVSILPIIALLIGSLLFGSANAQGWSSDDMALFDLVEEVKISFYELFSIPKDAKKSVIKKAYFKLSLKYHPDKNKQADAAEKFRQIAGVYEVLKDEKKREQYDNILEHGLPDWRTPVFYYRNLRKMPWWESLALLFLIVSLGHYLMLWGSYIDRRLTLTEALESKFRKQEKKLKRNQKLDFDVDEKVEEELKERLGRPGFWDTLPIVTGKCLLVMVLGTPSFVIWLISLAKPEPPVIEEEIPEETDEERRARRGVVYTAPVDYQIATDVKPVSSMNYDAAPSDQEAKDCGSGLMGSTGEWSVEDAALLIRLSTTKFPVGTSNRWEKIANVMRRKPTEITQMIGKIKKMDPNEYQKLANFSATDGGQSSVPTKSQKLPSPTTTIISSPSSSSVPKNSAGANSQNDPNSAEQWTQQQQKLFEKALSSFPKGTDDRWERISDVVPGKSKEECMERFKYLAAMLRQRKAASGAGKNDG